MKVRHLSGPKANTTEHFPPHVATVLIASGLAEAVPLPPRGAPGWAEARQEMSRAANPVEPETITWGFTPAGGNFGVPTIIKRNSATTETTYFDPSVTKLDGRVGFTTEITFPDGCPESIKRQWSEAVNRVYAPQTDGLEEAKNKQYLQKQQERIGMAKYLRT